jgi:hypothetical protein
METRFQTQQRTPTSLHVIKIALKIRCKRLLKRNSLLIEFSTSWCGCLQVHKLIGLVWSLQTSLRHRSEAAASQSFKPGVWLPVRTFKSFPVWETTQHEHHHTTPKRVRVVILSKFKYWGVHKFVNPYVGFWPRFGNQFIVKTPHCDYQGVRGVQQTSPFLLFPSLRRRSARRSESQNYKVSIKSQT